MIRGTSLIKGTIALAQGLGVSSQQVHPLADPRCPVSLFSAWLRVRPLSFSYQEGQDVGKLEGEVGEEPPCRIISSHKGVFLYESGPGKN